jgi:hypothetical protein
MTYCTIPRFVTTLQKSLLNIAGLSLLLKSSLAVTLQRLRTGDFPLPLDFQRPRALATNFYKQQFTTPEQQSSDSLTPNLPCLQNRTTNGTARAFPLRLSPGHCVGVRFTFAA